MSVSLDCRDGQHFACAISGGCCCECHGLHVPYAADEPLIIEEPMPVRAYVVLIVVTAIVLTLGVTFIGTLALTDAATVLLVALWGWTLGCVVTSIAQRVSQR
jgi:hypothetical protein